MTHLHEVKGNMSRIVHTETNTEHQVDAGDDVDGQAPPGHQGHHIDLGETLQG